MEQLLVPNGQICNILPFVDPLFTENARETLKRAIETFAARGEQYGDTWRDCQHLTLRAVFTELLGQELPFEICDCIAAAVLCDVKYQRLQGGWHEDHLIDGINYQAYLVEAMRRLRTNESCEPMDCPE